jgi:hypothetical protein
MLKLLKRGIQMMNVVDVLVIEERNLFSRKVFDVRRLMYWQSLFTQDEFSGGTSIIPNLN